MIESTTIGLVPGPGVAVVGDSSFALLAAAPPTLVDHLWRLVDAGSDIDALLDAASSGGLRTLGSFAFVRIEADGIRVVVRGDATVRLGTPGSEQSFDARGVRTWAEHFLAGATSFEIRLGTGVDDVDHFHVQRGVVPASAIKWPHVQSTIVDRSGSATDVGEVGDNPSVSRDEPADASGTPEPNHDDSLPAAVRDEDTQSDHIGSDAGATVSLSGFGDFDDEASSSVMHPSNTPGSTAPGDRERGPDDGYDALYGHTIHRSVQQAAVEPEPDAPGTGDSFASPSLEEVESPLPWQPSLPEPVVPPAAGIISGVPISSGPDAGPSPTGIAPIAQLEEGDHDGHTISAAQLRAMRSGGATQPSAPVAPMGGPTVQALVCRSGHPNPPHLSTCRTCHAVLDGTPQIVARPSLGRIVLSTGDVIELTRPAVIGRNPKVEGRLPSEVPQTVRLDVGQALSRSHVMVRLEHWQVLVEDLGSANGTVVTLPGRPPQRLHAGEPILLESGSEIDLGGEVVGTFHAGV